MNIATIGTGFIVDAILSAMNEVDGVNCTAIYSRKRETAEPLADKYGVQTIYTDLNELYTDPDVDFIYIASPNSMHYEQAYQALQHGKHVVCEKPFTSTALEAQTLIELAREKNLFLFEAISNIHLPNYNKVKEQLSNLGNIRFIQCNYSQYSSKYNQLLAGETPNVFNPEFSGGALMDINIYNLHFVMKMFGSPETVSYTANQHVNGIDTSGVVVLKYPEFIAECVGCKDTSSMNFVLIQGEKGYIQVVGGANGCQEIKVQIGQEPLESINVQAQSNWLYYEWEAFRNIYINKDYTKCYELLSHSQSVMNILAEARKDAGIVFAADRV
ncbi:Gfo/Idh/MocA family oxidoreductase [Paenibacillus sp. ACRRY]|uniref:Gfo/Idh/MocA family protein n=1 Tax=Paenibacillus sp. ACRRY TaxID=2918208 RepID=UPI001EF73D38|nr:Gfo/Idh/MocA family oxidoreductase [Paenibacillus sp. ACRRY]MCG7385156.1 Gfo/Idh/MocA family oxidoreductase [Paenibacillus sp. ACRRY]